ncbi:MAG: alpha/beta hydrolase [Rhodoferax sp.]|nr:alpha/beta hydrolase [Rhodoferax sp.]
MMRWIGVVLCMVVFLPSVRAAEPIQGLTQAQLAPGRLQRVASAREGADIPVYLRAAPGAKGTLVLLPGGSGGIGKIGPQGWPDSPNFLVRSAPLFAAQGFNLAIVARPSDQTDMDYPFRVSAPAMDDLRRVLRQVRGSFAGPVWVVGTSRGTVSGTAAAIALREEGLIDGLVLTASVTSAKTTGAVPLQALDKISIPVMVVHHEKDACRVCRPDEVPAIDRGLVNSRRHALLMLSGGEGESGNPCEALHFHGFIGVESQAVGRITDWIAATPLP